MRLLLDTQILIWAITLPARLPAAAVAEIEDDTNEKLFSAASIWEVAIKFALRKPDFLIDPAVLLRTARLDFTEIDVISRAVLGVAALPSFHRDPFDRLLIAQAAYENAELLTVDGDLAPYGPPVRYVGPSLRPVEAT